LNKSKRNKYLEIAIIVTFIVVLIYVGSMTVRITTGVSKTVESAAHTVRLQVLNGCGVPGLADKTADKLADYRDDDLEIKIVDTDNFDIRKVTESFVISRLEDKTAARMLAEKIGLDPSRVIYKALENNYRHVTATLVLGEDHDKIKLTTKSDEES
jgi:hypothetical protein